jgi:hypothetical protein
MRTDARMPISHLLPDWMQMPTLPFLVGNELRAVFPTFAGALALIVVSMMIDPNYRESVAFVGYGLGSVAIAASAFGHDFAHRTLLATLAQPVSRRQIWRIRMVTALSTILPLTIIGAWPLGLYRLLSSLILDVPNHSASDSTVLMLVAFLSSVCIAPCLTLLCRSALAGTVLTICVPFILMYGGEYAWSLIIVWPLNHPVFLWYLAFSFIVTCVIGFVGTRVLWDRLQVIDARPVSLTLGNWKGIKARTRAPTRRRSPWLQLAWKEARLQWLAIVPVVGMCATAASFSKTPQPNFGIEMLIYTMGFWAVFLCLILGSVGSAEERQLGLSDSQALLPVPKTTQWLIKVGLLFLLAYGFAVCLPLALLDGTTGRADLPIPGPNVWQMSAICITSLALFVSSCCRTTMKAVLVSLPLSVAALGVIDLVRISEEMLIGRTRATVHEVIAGTARRFTYTLTSDDSIVAFTIAAPYIFGAGLIALLLVFACRNHFSAERSGGELARQLFWLLGAFVVAFVGSLSLHIRASALH